MHDANKLVKLIKKAALDAVDASKPTNVCFGKVQSVNPLKIDVEQRMTLGEKQLILSKHVTDFETEVSIDMVTEKQSGGTGQASFASHNHNVTGKTKIIVHNGLVVGDEVLLVRQQGGQKFVVWDRYET